VSDERLRDLERKYHLSGSDEDAEALLHERLRSVDLTIMILKTLVRLERTALSTSSTSSWRITLYERDVTSQELLEWLDKMEGKEPTSKEPPVLATARRILDMAQRDVDDSQSRRQVMAAAQSILDRQSHLHQTGVTRTPALTCGCASAAEHNQKLSDHDL
jgi:hypothetical protein